MKAEMLKNSAFANLTSSSPHLCGWEHPVALAVKLADNLVEQLQLASESEHSKRKISRLVGMSRGTVDRALEAGRVPKYQRLAAPSSFEPQSPVASRWTSSTRLFLQALAAGGKQEYHC